VLIGLVLVGTVIEGTYFFRVIQVVYFKGKTTDTVKEEVPLAAMIPISILTILIIVIGIYPGFITNVLNSAASEFLQRIDYVKGVLG